MLIIYVIIAIIVGLFLMAPLAWIFDTMKWPAFNAWELAHGYWLLAWPLLSVASLLCILAIARRFRSRSQ